MHIITGGTYEDREYSCMYDVSETISHQDRYDKESDLIGLQGFVETNGREDGRKPAMLWFSGQDVCNLHFEKGERYFPDIDMTYNEIKKDLQYDIDTFEATDTEGYCMDGLVEYQGFKYGVYVSAWDDTTATWEEAIIVSLAEDLAKIRYSTPLAEAIKNKYIFDVYDDFAPWIYEADLWCTLYYNLNDARLTRATNAFEMNGLCDATPDALHEENKQWIFAATQNWNPAECLEAFKDNPVIQELIYECYPNLKK